MKRNTALLEAKETRKSPVGTTRAAIQFKSLHILLPTVQDNWETS